MVQVNRQLLVQGMVLMLLIGIDQYFKWLALNQQSPILLNHGVSFGWLLLPTMWQIGLIGVLLVFLTLLGWHQPRWQLTAILAGGWSNWFDRVTTGAVIDWLPIPGTNITNNLADYWITIGVLSFVFSTAVSVWKKNLASV